MEELKIGIVAEGITDYWVLKHIVEKYLKGKGAYTVPLQPKETKAGKQGGFGGWKKVFEYIEKKECIIDLAQMEGCAYVIVHLDSDKCDCYKVKKIPNSEALFDNILRKIYEKVHPDFDKSKIIPAICIHCLEC
jgi:hypothetical protein